MEREAAAFPAGLDDQQRAAAARPFDDDQRRWLQYRPEPRPGLLLADMGLDTRKAAHRLLATALSPPAYAQAMAAIAPEEVRRPRGDFGGDLLAAHRAGPSQSAFTQAWTVSRRS